MQILTEHSEENLDNGVSEDEIAAAETALGFPFPHELRRYLERFNYAELHGDPIFGIHSEPGMSWCNIVDHNLNHPVPGHVSFFSSDIDSTCSIRLETGQVFRPDLKYEAAPSFSQFIMQVIQE